MTAAANDQDQRKLDAAITERLHNAVMRLDTAEGVLQISGAQDIPLDELSQADRFGYAAANASIARAHAEIAYVQSQVGLQWQLQELAIAVRAIVNNAASPPTAVDPSWSIRLSRPGDRQRRRACRVSSPRVLGQAGIRILVIESQQST
jgi:hypothetical protein